MTKVLSAQLNEDVAATILVDFLSSDRVGYRDLEGAFNTLLWTTETLTEHPSTVIDRAVRQMELPDNTPLAQKNGVRSVFSALLKRLPKPATNAPSSTNIPRSSNDPGTGGSGSGFEEQAPKKAKYVMKLQLTGLQCVFHACMCLSPLSLLSYMALDTTNYNPSQLSIACPHKQFGIQLMPAGLQLQNGPQ